MKTIRITYAHLHNLKDISLEIPRQQLVAITGVSPGGGNEGGCLIAQCSPAQLRGSPDSITGPYLYA